MHFYGIAIYDRSDSGEFKRINVAQQSKGMFVKNDMETLEKKTLPNLSSPATAGFHYAVKEGEHSREYHYVEFRKGIAIAICSRTKLEAKEIPNLFNNIHHAHVRPIIVKTTLEQILNNPIGYIGRDLQMGRITDETAKVKAVMLDNIEKALARGESLEILEEKSIRLQENALKFNRKAEKLNSCCKFM